MTEADYKRVRADVLARKEPPGALMEECERIVTLLVRTSGLPPHYSPYGVWSDEAIKEVLADWIEARLIGRGQLLAMMQRAPVLRTFRRMAETSVRQHLIDSLKRSQSANLYERVVQLLNDDEAFEGRGGEGGLWQLRDGPGEPFDGGERELLSEAWALGHFEVVRYDLEARKLSPLLDSESLKRFVEGILKAGAMSVATLMQALRMRFSIDEPRGDEELIGDLEARADGPEQEALISDLVTATLAELSERQAAVLIGLDQGKTGAELALELGCSAGTVSYERRSIEDILARLGTDAPAVLKKVLDSLFREDT